MTVDDFQMRVRARGTRASIDDADEERWKQLAHVRDGRREKWMTDRAKHALGTPKLASVFLREEKGRVHRLRKIKSVLASGNLMGNSSGGATPYSTTQADRRGRRRPYGNLSQQNSHGYHMSHRRFPKTEDTNYPTNPFGNIGKDALQLPEPTMRRSSLGKAVMNSRNDNGNSPDSSKVVWNDDSRAIQQVVSILGGGKGGLYGSQSDLDRISEAPAAREDQHGSSRSQRNYQRNGSESTSERERTRQGTGPHDGSGAIAEQNQAISSGPSAIDLFDQCGLIPMAAVEKEGLVGTTSTFRPDHESENYDKAHGKDMMSSMSDRRYPVPPALVAPKPPLIPGGASSTTARNHPRDAQARAPRASTKRSQATMRHGVKPRPPFSGGSVSTLSRSKHDQKPQVAGDIPRSGGKLRRGVQNEAAAKESTSRRSRIAGPQTEGSPSSQTSTPVADNGNRVRRRWKVDEASATAASFVPKSSGAAKGIEPTETKVVSSASASASASEQRIASAKERLHKDKGLDALKSEHVEALSILQDISCPSTATVAAEASGDASATSAEEGGGDGTTEDGTIGVAKEAPLRRGKGNLATAAGSAPEFRVGGFTGLPADAEVDEISADLPRIGSEEQAALRGMYREWWMKVANGGSPPTLGASDNTPGGQSLDLTEPDETADPGVAAPRVGQQPLPLKDRAIEKNICNREGDTSVTRAAGVMGEVEDQSGLPDNGRSLGPGVADKNGGVKIRAPEESSVGGDAAVLEPPYPAPDESHNDKSCPNESEGSRVEASAAGLSQEIGVITSGMSGPASTKTGAERPSSEQESVFGSVALPLGAEATPREKKGDAADLALATASALVSSSPPTPAEGSPQKQQQQQQQKEQQQQQQKEQQQQQQKEQQQPCGSDVESVSEDDDLEKGEEEGLHGRIYLPDGRFVSTLHRSGEEKDTADATERIGRHGEGVWGDDDDDEVVVGKPARKEADDESLGYADEDFEFED